MIVEQLDRLVQFHFGAGVAVTASLACGISSRKEPTWRGARWSGPTGKGFWNLPCLIRADFALREE